MLSILSWVFFHKLNVNLVDDIPTIKKPQRFHWGFFKRLKSNELR